MSRRRSRRHPSTATQFDPNQEHTMSTDTAADAPPSAELVPIPPSPSREVQGLAIDGTNVLASLLEVVKPMTSPDLTVQAAAASRLQIFEALRDGVRKPIDQLERMVNRLGEIQRTAEQAFGEAEQIARFLTPLIERVGHQLQPAEAIRAETDRVLAEADRVAAIAQATADEIRSRLTAVDEASRAMQDVVRQLPAQNVGQQAQQTLNAIAAAHGAVVQLLAALRAERRSAA